MKATGAVRRIDDLGRVVIPKEIRRTLRIREGKLPPVTEATGLGDIILGNKQGRTSDDQRFCFIAGGMPIWDVGWGYELYLNAKEKGLGTDLKLWDSPYLC